MTVNRTAHALARLRPPPDEPDAELLRRYAAARDAAAFEAIVRRHAALVYAACRRATGHAHDAEDAFQAVFLVLARNAGSVRDPHRLPAYLYGVAVRVARKARTRRREQTGAAVPEPQTPPPDDWADVGPVIDEEIAALPAWYREAVFACDVQHQPRAEAAARLGIPEGTLSSRLAKGRKLLAARLARRGVTLALPALASGAAAAVPERLVRLAVETAAAGAAGGHVGPSISDLAREGMTVVRKLLLLGGGVLAVTALGVGLAGDPAQPPAADPPAAKPAAVADDVPKPEAKPAALRQRGIVNVPHRLTSVRWAVDGKRILLLGSAPGTAAEHFGVAAYAVKVVAVAADGLQPPAGPDWDVVRGEVIGTDPADPLGLVAHVKEEGGINVRNELVRYQLRADGKTAVKSLGRVALADDVLFGVQTTADGKQALMVASDEATGGCEIREIDPTTGRPTRVVFRTPENYWAMSGNAATVFTTVNDKGGGDPPARGAVVREVHAWDATTNKRKCAWKVPERTLEVVQVVPSHDGRAFAVVDNLGAVAVVNAATGKEVRRYEPAENRSTSNVFLSHDGRLAAVCELAASQPPAAGGAPGGAVVPARPDKQFVTLHDTATGRPVKKWETNHTVELAFAPDRAALAVLETPRAAPGGPGMGGPGMGGPPGMPGGMAPAAGTREEATGRLGLWDFGK